MKFYVIRATILLFLIKVLAKLFFVEMPAVPSATALIQKDDRFLFIDLTYKTGLALPGGIIQAGESAEKALKREVKEETGLDVVGYTFLWSVATATKGIGSLSLVFKIQTQGKIRGSSEGEPMWLTPEEAFDRLAYRTNEKALRKYLKRIQ